MSRVSSGYGVKVVFLPSLRRIANGNLGNFGYYFT